MIITAGINVYPEDVTAVIRSMQDVVDAVTFGLNDDVWGERVVSCVQASDENVTIEAVAAHCGTNLSREKLPNQDCFIFQPIFRAAQPARSSAKRNQGIGL